MQSSDHDYKSSFAREGEYYQKGKRIIFEGEEAYVIREKPLLVIKTKNRVVCGALHKCLSELRVKSLLKVLKGTELYTTEISVPS
jgi:hypothetical protein